MRPKRVSPGERAFSALLPGRSYLGSWGQQDLTKQVEHFRELTYIFIDIIAAKLASITPNIAYVSDQPIPGKTTKAGSRSLYNLLGRGYGGSPYIGGSYRPERGSLSYDERGIVSAPTKGRVEGVYLGTGGWDERAEIPGGLSFSDGGHSFLTMGEYRSKALSVVQPHEELEPLENDHPLRSLIHDPNPYDTYYDYTYEKWMYLLLCGVGYEWLVPNEYRTMPGERWIIPSHWVWPRTGGRRPREVERRDAGWNGARDEGASYVNPYNLPDLATGQGSQRLIDYFEIRPWGGLGGAGILKFPPEEVIMTRFKSPLDKIGGWSPLAAMARTIDSEESIINCRWGQFNNQARPELWVELGAGYEDPTDDKIARYEQKMMAKFQGEFNYGKPIFTPPGSKLNVLSFKPEEMGYVQSYEQLFNTFASAFRVPKSAVGVVENMTYGSLLASLGAFCTYNLNIRLAFEGQTQTKHLASRWDETTPAYSTLSAGGHGSRATSRKVKLFYDDCVPADPAQVNADLDVDARNFAVTPNEIRAIRGRKSYELGGDNPIALGAGGPVPLAINVPENVDELAQIVAQMTQAAGKSPGETAEGLPEPEKPKLEEGKPTDQQESPVNRLPKTDMADDASGIAEPNGKPSKRQKARKISDIEQHSRLLDIWMDGRRRGKIETDKDGDRDNPYRPGEEYDAWKAGFKQKPFPFEYAPSKRYWSLSKSWPHERKNDKPRKFGCVLIYLPDDVSEAVLQLAANIADEDLTDDGRETGPHVTVKYGLVTDDAGKVRRIVEDFGPINMTLGKVSYFSTEETGKGYDVVKIDVESDDLQRLNQLIADGIECKPDDYDYHPHVTLAYVKPGAGEVYTDLPGAEELNGQTVEVREVVYSTPSGNKTALQTASYEWVKKSLSAEGIPLVKDEAGMPLELIDLPDIRQRDTFSCGAAVCMAVGKFFGVGPETLEEWKDALGTTERSSTMPPRIVAYLRELGLDVHDQHDMTIADLAEAWTRGCAVICPVQEYGVPTKQTSTAYGHYVAVIGVALGNVFVQDPSIDNALQEPGGTQGDKPAEDILQAPGRSLIPLATWEEAWHDRDAAGNDYLRYGIVVGPPRSAAPPDTDDDEDEPEWDDQGEWPDEYGDPVGITDVVDKGVLDTLQSAGRYLAAKWASLADRYGEKAALAMAISMIATLPLPGSIPAIVAVAEGIRGISGYLSGGSNGPVNRLKESALAPRAVNKRLSVDARVVSMQESVPLAKTEAQLYTDYCKQLESALSPSENSKGKAVTSDS